ncbi:MAG: phosphotransferase family protein [Halioglobus sp.]|nr:phosphotransferase family protein [Halioglobus sp.]
MENARPTPLIDDIDSTRRKLACWISEQQGRAVSIAELTIPEATGMSNVTLLFDINWEEQGAACTESIVARLQPSVERPVFPDYDLSLQYEVMEVLGRESDVPVPELRGLETDDSVLGVQFYLMKKTEGRIPTDMPPYNMDGWMVHETSLEQRRSLWRSTVDTLATFHQLDYRALGFERLHAPGMTPLQQQLNYWQTYHDWALEGAQHGICQPALDWLQANQPEEEATTLCWGDARLANIIFKPSLDGIAAVLDWEMAVLGNPVQDLAWFNYLDSAFAEGLGMPRLEGLPSYEETVTQWQNASSCSVRDYSYYIVFAGMRFGLILSRIMLATGQNDEVQTNFACQLLQKNLDRLG